MIWPLHWFGPIIFWTWPFDLLSYINLPGALAAELVWLGFIAVMRERKRRHRGRSHRVDARP